VINEILMTGVSFSMVPGAQGNGIPCRRDIECFELLKNCPFYRVCGPKNICICYRKEESTLKVNQSILK
jgi:hypothetical protein